MLKFNISARDVMDFWGLRNEIVLFILVFAVFNLNFHDSTSGDTIAVKYLPLSILSDFDLDLSEFGDLRSIYGHGFINLQGDVLPSFPPFMAFLALPFYLPLTLLNLKGELFIQSWSSCSPC